MARRRCDAPGLCRRGRPGARALLGLWFRAAAAAIPEELAFGALTAPFVAALLIEAAAYGLGGDRIQERYFFYAVPLVGILFALYASRGWPHRLAHGVLAAGLVLLAARVPLSGFAAMDGKTNSPTLFAAARSSSRPSATSPPRRSSSRWASRSSRACSSS